MRTLIHTLVLGLVVAGAAPLSGAQTIVDGQMQGAIPSVDNNSQLLDLEASRAMEPGGAREGGQGGGGISFAL